MPLEKIAAIIINNIFIINSIYLSRFDCDFNMSQNE